jgi:GT2 family glycosyltransferase/predicted SAM-dependent methyltransferase
MLSIIIPVFNQHEMTRECIKAVLQHTKDFEIIVIDNGSEPRLEWADLGLRVGDVIYCNDTNLGFPAAVNQGIRIAKGETIVLLNNDVIVTPDWMNRLRFYIEPKTRLEKTESDDGFNLHEITYPPAYSIVGPLTNYCTGLQHTLIPVYRNAMELDSRAMDWQVSHASETQEVNYVIGFCMAFRKSLFDEIGDFDENLWPCSGEEVDFCLRALQAGHKIGIAKDVYVHHEGSQTLKAMDVDYAEICKRNNDHLAEKWGPNFWNQTVEEPKTGLLLNLGCGYRKLDGYVNIDNRAEVKPDLLCDVLQGLPYSDNSVDEVRAYDFLEHIPQPHMIEVIEEIYRVLKPNGIFESFTPSTDGRGAFQDPTHVSYWNRNSWSYYSDPTSRDLYGIKANFTYAMLEDVITSVGHNIIHTHVVGKAVK